MIKDAYIELCKFSGESITKINCISEHNAQEKMDQLYTDRNIFFEKKEHPVSEFYSSLCIGFVRMYVVDEEGNSYERRSFYINA